MHSITFRPNFSVQSLKESADELDAGMQFHLTRYAFLFESTVLHDGVTLVPSGVEDGPSAICFPHFTSSPPPHRPRVETDNGIH